MSCRVGQYLPNDDTPVAEVGHVVHLPKRAFPRSQRRRRGFLPRGSIEMLVDTSEGQTLHLLAYGRSDGEFFAELQSEGTFLRKLHTHDGHRNPRPLRTPVPGPHMHFPTRKFPLTDTKQVGSYAYPVDAPKFRDTSDYIQFFCSQIDIEIEGFQPYLTGRRR